MNTVVNEYTLYLQGIFGRNRTSKFESFKLVQLPIDSAPLTESELDAMVDTKKAEIKLKSHTRLFVKVNQLTFRTEGTMQIMKCKPFDARLVKNYQ